MSSKVGTEICPPGRSDPASSATSGEIRVPSFDQRSSASTALRGLAEDSEHHFYTMPGSPHIEVTDPGPASAHAPQHVEQPRGDRVGEDDTR
jgi:hypothetical protein